MKVWRNLLDFRTNFENMSHQNFFIAYLWAQYIIPILLFLYEIPRGFVRLSLIYLKLFIAAQSAVV